jgi:hypothetical protein
MRFGFCSVPQHQQLLEDRAEGDRKRVAAVTSAAQSERQARSARSSQLKAEKGRGLLEAAFTRAQATWGAAKAKEARKTEKLLAQRSAAVDEAEMRSGEVVALQLHVKRLQRRLDKAASTVAQHQLDTRETTMDAKESELAWVKASLVAWDDALYKEECGITVREEEVEAALQAREAAEARAEKTDQHLMRLGIFVERLQKQLKVAQNTTTVEFAAKVEKDKRSLERKRRAYTQKKRDLNNYVQATRKRCDCDEE